jgi:hypothetical protein
MSSGEDDFFENEEGSSTAFPSSKKRKVQRACDICRRKKGPQSLLRPFDPKPNQHQPYCPSSSLWVTKMAGRRVS